MPGMSPQLRELNMKVMDGHPTLAMQLWHVNNLKRGEEVLHWFLKQKLTGQRLADWFVEQKTFLNAMKTALKAIDRDVTTRPLFGRDFKS